MQRIMSEPAQERQVDGATVSGAEPTLQPDEQANKEQKKPPRQVTLYLVRHGQSTFNVEKRLPGQLPDIGLTDEGKRQAEQLAEAIRELPLTAIVTSPLERARATAEIVGKNHDVPIHLEPRLMDTDVGAWSGQVIEDLNKNDPEWARFVRRPTQPPSGVEGFYQVLSRVVPAAEEVRRNEALGNAVMLVAHADVIQLLVAHYLHLPIEGGHWLHIDNASITVLAFEGDRAPWLVALNWLPSPAWLRPPPPVPPSADATAPEKSEG
jgi:probable phosphoglycerate mutase